MSRHLLSRVATVVVAAIAVAGAMHAAAAPPADIASAQRAPCGRLLDARETTRGATVSEDDLVRLRDIGSALSASAGEQVFTISPDGRRVAFQVHQAMPARNGYCVGVVIAELRPGARGVVVDSGDELIRYRTTFRGRLDYPFGFARTITPRWSADGRRVAFLKEVGGRIQAWEAATDGSGSRQMTNLAEDVDDLRYAPDGSALVLKSRPDVPRRVADLAGEGLTGHRYDDRFAPMARQSPFPPGPAPSHYLALTLANGALSEATPEQTAAFPTDGVDAITEGTASSRSADGDVATLRPVPSGLLTRKQSLDVLTSSGRTVHCSDPACGDRIVSAWWTADGKRVSFLRREGDSSEISRFYEWRPGRAPPRAVLSTSDYLFGCLPAGRLVACMRETSLRPRHLALIDPAAGVTRVAFDPNPEFQRLTLGRAERMEMHDAFGAPFFADLVYPVGYRVGTRYPLVIVQYESRGFLRGGTGDEYPIQTLAGRGFMVLSVNRPPVLAFAPRATSGIEVDRLNLRDFTLRRAVHSGIVSAVGLLVRRGLVDPRRVGITGLSEGSSEVQWALIHDHRFAAAAMSGCCWGPQTMALTGLQAAQEYRSKGYPPWTSRIGARFWREISLADNAPGMNTPLLIQAADDELLDAVDAYTALHAVDAPVDLLVFPGEHHVKWQPAHRLAIYRRNVEWFAFWLQGAASHVDVPRWRAWRDRLNVSGSRPPPNWSAPAPAAADQ